MKAVVCEVNEWRRIPHLWCATSPPTEGHNRVLRAGVALVAPANGVAACGYKARPGAADGGWRPLCVVQLPALPLPPHADALMHGHAAVPTTFSRSWHRKFLLVTCGTWIPSDSFVANLCRHWHRLYAHELPHDSAAPVLRSTKVAHGGQAKVPDK